MITLSVLKLVQESSSSSSYSLNQKFEDPKEDPLKAYEDYKENTLQRKYTVLVNQKSEDCYFITDVKLGRTLTVDFVVIKAAMIVKCSLFVYLFKLRTVYIWYTYSNDTSWGFVAENFCTVREY